MLLIKYIIHYIETSVLTQAVIVSHINSDVGYNIGYNSDVYWLRNDPQFVEPPYWHRSWRSNKESHQSKICHLLLPVGGAIIVSVYCHVVVFRPRLHRLIFNALDTARLYNKNSFYNCLNQILNWLDLNCRMNLLSLLSRHFEPNVLLPLTYLNPWATSTYQNVDLYILQ